MPQLVHHTTRLDRAFPINAVDGRLRGHDDKGIRSADRHGANADGITFGSIPFFAKT